MIPPINKSSEPRFSLSFLVAFWTAVAIVGALCIYAFVQYLLLPEMSATEFFLHHFWHVFVLGALIHLLCWFVLRTLLLRPLNQVYVHLYSLGAGDIRELELRSSVKEIAMIVEGINIMTWRLHHWLDADALAATRKNIEEIDVIITQLRLENEDVADALKQRVEALDSSLLSVVEAKGRENGGTDEDSSSDSW